MSAMCTGSLMPVSSDACGVLLAVKGKSGGVAKFGVLVNAIPWHGELNMIRVATFRQLNPDLTSLPRYGDSRTPFTQRLLFVVVCATISHQTEGGRNLTPTLSKELLCSNKSIKDPTLDKAAK
jgi:hypothetical protein